MGVANYNSCYCSATLGGTCGFCCIVEDEVKAAEKIDGWMNPVELKWLAERAYGLDVVVEFGSWKGRSTRALCTAKKIIAVDCWNGIIDGKTIEPFVQFEFFNNLERSIRGRQIVMLKQYTNEILLPKGEVDMVFIDADHEYWAVKRDIAIARKLLKPDGLLCGHDYSNDYPGVKKAVAEDVPNHKKIEGGDIWYEVRP